MSIFSAFSGSGRNQQRDGTWIVYCSECREPICRTSIQLGKVKCELCRRVENGETLTDEAVQQYRASKISVMGVSAVRLPPPEELPKDSNINPIRTMGHGFVRALGFNKKREETKAEEVVQEKKRSRLFESRDLEGLGDAQKDGDSLGSMDDFKKMMEDERGTDER